jgi:L-fucose isomerase-like protein
MPKTATRRTSRSTTSHKPRIGVFAGYDPRPWVMRDCADQDIARLEALIARLQATAAYEIVWPGGDRSGWDKLCHTTALCEQYAAAFARAGVDGLLNVHPTWTFPQTSQKVVAAYAQKLKAKDPTARPRLCMVSIQDPTVPGMVSGMATGGAFNQNGEAFVHVYGDFDSAATLRELRTALDMFGRRAAVQDRVRAVVDGLHNLHAIEFGSFSLQMPTTRIDQEELTKRWGITSESLDQQVFLDRAFLMFDWQGAPGLSPVAKIRDQRVAAAVAKNFDAHPEKFTAIAGRTVTRDKYALQVAMYFATFDIAREKGAGAVTIKCQDECSGKYATCCMATSFLGNDVDPLGKKKPMIPTSCETDLPTMYSQYLLKELAGVPAGFGDFRYVATGKDGKTLLAIVNCGQHPLYYAGRESDPVEQKFANTDHPGQEHFYAAGGASVRMRTAKDQDVTVARLGVENGRLYLCATIMRTTDVAPKRHQNYNPSWPIIEGHVPVTDKVLGRRWPSNHLGFVYGDHVAALIELAERMGIGYQVWDRDGAEYWKPS